MVVTEREIRVRDRKILQQLSEGKTANEIGKSIKISGRTVEYRFEVLKEVHGAKNIPNLIAIAAKKKLIKLK